MSSQSGKPQHPRRGIKWCFRRHCWVIDKVFKKHRIYCITFTANGDEAERILDAKLLKLYETDINGGRPCIASPRGPNAILNFGAVM